MDTILRAIKGMSVQQRAHELNVFILDQVDEVRQSSVIGMVSNDLVIHEAMKDDNFVIAVMRSWGNSDHSKITELLNKKAYELLLEQHIGANL